MHILNLFVFLFLYTFPIFSCAHGRRVLHRPFFPMSSSWPPAQPPAVNFPKYPASTNQRPFFPSYTTPRPPPPPSPAAFFSSSSLPTFPANISSFISPASHSSTTKLLGAIAIPIISLALLSLVLFLFFFYRHRCRRRAVEDDEGSDSDRLFPPNSAASDGRKPLANSGPVSSEFLYLGTLVSAGAMAEGEASVAPSSSSPCRKLGSPELRPLPPLARNVRRGEGEGGMSSEEEFYSPSVSPGEMRNPVFSPALSFRAPEKRGSPVSTLSSPSYPSSNAASSPSPSSPPVSSAPFGSSPGRPTNKIFQPPPPPPPQRPLRPTTPLPSQWKPFSSSLSYSPSAKTQHLFSTQKLWSQWSIVDVPRNSSVVTMPPLPPPLPPNGHIEKKIPNTSTAELCPTDPPQTSDILERSDETPRPKLKPLHWDKVKATSDRAMIWDRMKSGSFQLNEEMIETLFVRDTKNLGIEEGRRLAAVAGTQDNRLLDAKKSQNIAILLRALNVTKEEVCEALLDGNADSLGTDLLETLLRMAPSKEEELKLREHNESSSFKLGPAERFLKALLDIPFAFKRVEAMLYLMNFDSEVHYLKESFQTLEIACEELRSSRLFLKLLEAVLKTGNRMNVGTDRGDAQAFKLDTLLKLVDVRAADGKTNLLHFVVQEIIKAEGSRCHAANSSTAKPRLKAEEGDVERRRLGLQVVSGLANDLRNVSISASLDSGALSVAVMKLAGGIGKIREVLRLNEALNPNEKNATFHDSMLEFLKKAEVELVELQAQEGVAVSLVKETTEYFHGDSAKEEAHPLRIFVIVRDFLGYLDQVCKEIGRPNERISAQAFPMFPSLRTGNSDEESL